MVTRDRAVVLGASMGGLLAARVLSEHYSEVVLVDRDPVTRVGPAPRRGVPHGRHAHGLVGAGYRLVEGWFPGLREQLAAQGNPTGDFNGDIEWYFGGVPMARSASDLVSVAAPRPVLEDHVRRRVAARENVKIVESHDVEGLVIDAAGLRVRGARLRSRTEPGPPTELFGDLVVDTTGRGSRTPRWLSELGYAPPEEERVRIGLAYTTRQYRVPEDPFDGDLAIIPVATPWSPRGGLFFPAPGENRATLSLTGILGDHAPTDHEGFTAFAESLPVPRIVEALRRAEPLDDAVRFTYPYSAWRHYERLRDFPRGLLVLGDGVCSFNPVYGQGMSVAAMEAECLARAVDRGTEQDRPLAYLRSVGKVVLAPWQTSAGADVGYPGVQGRRSPMTRFANAWVSRLQRSSTHDPELGAAFVRVAGLVDPPPALMRPSVAWRLARTTPTPAESPAPAVTRTPARSVRSAA